ncbi:MAG: precorrin-6y C5,15-methyltransferase (decarboxylating) subunit CbiE [Planctomycetota bacterium]|nr:precorrin-6y C5,15-methyltransferase (decarboxylating) subunit CbiE [Planctomycetota bacterium]
MTEPVWVIGVGADGFLALSGAARSALDASTWLAGGRRHLELIATANRELFTISNNVADLVARLQLRGQRERCVVLASGDPLLFGIGTVLINALGNDQVRIEPAVSSMQLAFSRTGLAWHDAAIVTVHGRPLKPALLPLLGVEKIGIFTTDGQGPSEIASFLLDRGAVDYVACVCERLGTCNERVTHARLPELIGQVFDPLNVVILRLDRSSNRGDSSEKFMQREDCVLADEDFVGPATGPILLTHADVRALVVQRFRGLRQSGPIWDVGAGLGGVSVSLADSFRDREVVAFERDVGRLGYLRANRAKFGAFNLRVVEGSAPACFAGESESPAGVFLGGSGGNLAIILEAITARLATGGVLVANFIAIQHLAYTMSCLHQKGWSRAVTMVQISQERSLGGATTFLPLRPVWVVHAVAPA